LTRAEVDALIAPFSIDLGTWIKALMSAEEFPEQDPESIALGMLAQVLLAETSEEALASMELDRAKLLCGDTPGGRSPALLITGARPMRSDYEEGATCYAIISAVKIAEGEKIQFTTGSKAVQTVIAKHLWEGWMPFKAALEIRRERTKRGYYPLNLVAGI